MGQARRPARGNLETNPITVKPETASRVAEQSSWVPSPSCSPPGRPFPITSPALSARVSPRTFHFQVLDKSLLSGPGRGLPSCNRRTRAAGALAAGPCLAQVLGLEDTGSRPGRGQGGCTGRGRLSAGAGAGASAGVGAGAQRRGGRGEQVLNVLRGEDRRWASLNCTGCHPGFHSRPCPSGRGSRGQTLGGGFPATRAWVLLCDAGPRVPMRSSAFCPCHPFRA